jgi:hypothetical protein
MADSNSYFASVANHWGEMRSGYFTEHMREAAMERARLPSDALVVDVGTGTGFVTRGLSLAALVFLPPILAAAAQSLPDLGILANSSRLLRQ